MALFYAKDFIYNNIPSAFHNIVISSTENNTMGVVAPGDVTPITQSVLRRPVPYFYRTQQTPVYTFQVEFNKQGDMDASEQSSISQWLFGQPNYHQLRIIQPDMQDIYYNCIFTAPQKKIVGNLVVGYSATAVCDAPWGWESSRSVSYTSPDVNGYSIYQNIVINNISDNSEYTYPIINFTANSFGGSFAIRNVTEDSSRYTHIYNLTAGEIVQMNCDLEIVYNFTYENSPTGSYVLKNLTYFNDVWPRMLQGVNIMRVQGNLSSVEIIYPIARKI